MKKLEFYKQILNLDSEEQIFNFLISNLKPSNMVWSYFVNWDKVFRNIKEIEIVLNNLNYLIGKEDFDNEFRFLLKENPKIANIIPALVVRDGKNTKEFKILVDYNNKKLTYENYDFSKQDISDVDIERYLLFVKETGLKHLIVSKKIKNLVDYMIGVEAGLDSNGRKNRSGNSMENIVEVFINDICRKNNFTYLKQANAKKIKQEFNIDVPVDKSSRRYDFVVNNGKTLFIIETNFYGGGGSKLKATAGEYRNLSKTLDKQYPFIWITDGLGWNTAVNPLLEAFNDNDYIFNLKMLEENILSYIIC
jgi:type II restriction enzyme